MSNTHTIIHDGVEHTLVRVTEISKYFDWLPMKWPATEAVKFMREHLHAQMDEDALEQLLSQAETAFERKRDEAAEFGSLVHEAIHQYLILKKPILSDEIKPHFEAFKEWSRKYRLSYSPGYTELQVHSFRRGGYIGRTDLPCEIKAPGWRKHRYCIVDLKVSPRIYKSAKYQIAMYRNAFQEMYGINVPHGAVLRFRKDKPGKIQFKLYSAGELQEAFYQCLPVLDSWYRRRRK